MSNFLGKTAVINGAPLDFSFSDFNKGSVTVTTITLTGVGTASVWITHLDNAPKKVLNAITTPADPFVLFGTGYGNIRIENDSGDVDATITVVAV